MKKATATILFLIATALILNPFYHIQKSEEIYVTEEGYEHFSLKTLNNTEWINKSFFAVTIFNSGLGFLSLKIDVLGASLVPCGKGSSLQLLLNIEAEGKIPFHYVPNDLILAVRGDDNSSMFYSFLLDYNDGVNTTSWQDNGGRQAQAWNPKAIYDGFIPHSSHFSAHTHLLWRVRNYEQVHTIKIMARLHGLESFTQTTITLTIGE